MPVSTVAMGTVKVSLVPSSATVIWLVTPSMSRKPGLPTAKKVTFGAPARVMPAHAGVEATPRDSSRAARSREGERDIVTP